MTVTRGRFRSQYEPYDTGEQNLWWDACDQNGQAVPYADQDPGSQGWGYQDGSAEAYDAQGYSYPQALSLLTPGQKQPAGQDVTSDTLKIGRRALLGAIAGVGVVGTAAAVAAVNPFSHHTDVVVDRSRIETALARLEERNRQRGGPSLMTRGALDRAEALEYQDLEASPEAHETGHQDAEPSPLAVAGTPPPLPHSKPTAIATTAKRRTQELQSMTLVADMRKPSHATPPKLDSSDPFSIDSMIAQLEAELGDMDARLGLDAAPGPQIASLSPDPSALSTPALGRAGAKLKLKSLNTGERLTIAPRDHKGRRDPGAIRALQAFMRDWRNDQQRDMDPGLYDQLLALADTWGKGDEVLVISAYRSPETNAMLRARSAGVAKGSYHMRGQALDFRLHHADLADLYHQALRLNAGGVGYYPGSNFIHIDTGPVREWPARYKASAQPYRKHLA